MNMDMGMDLAMVMRMDMYMNMDMDMAIEQGHGVLARFVRRYHTVLYSTMLTTDTASLRRDSPKTVMYKVSWTFISSKTTKVATGSTADTKAANTIKLMKLGDTE